MFPKRCVHEIKDLLSFFSAIPIAEYYHELMTVILCSSETKEVERSYTIYLYRGVCVGPEMSYERKISPGFTFKDFRNRETKVVKLLVLCMGGCPAVYQKNTSFHEPLLSRG